MSPSTNVYQAAITGRSRLVSLRPSNVDSVTMMRIPRTLPRSATSSHRAEPVGVTTVGA